MREKIWRGHQYSDAVCGTQVTTQRGWSDESSATVVHDSACFPVKEAMAFIRDQVAKASQTELEFAPPLMAKYLRAVERMKKKAKVSNAR